MAAVGGDPAKEEKLKRREELRAQIVEQIRDIAAETGGAPPELRQFEKMSGIRRHRFIGSIWARWPDALQEAGLRPKGAKGRLRNADMLTAFAQLARSLGRVPTVDDVKVHRAEGGNLPCYKSYAEHFGGSRGLLRALKCWAAASPDCADIAAMIRHARSGRRHRRRRNFRVRRTGALCARLLLPETRPQARGAVYLLRCGRLYKIGCSRTPDRRVPELQRGWPLTLKLMCMIETDDPFGLEAYWHRRFLEKRTRGEWFRLSAEDVAAFREWDQTHAVSQAEVRRYPDGRVPEDLVK
jgi:Meiotically Up-regulated Gene 113 (MUG113) protein